MQTKGNHYVHQNEFGTIGIRKNIGRPIAAMIVPLVMVVLACSALTPNANPSDEAVVTGEAQPMISTQSLPSNPIESTPLPVLTDTPEPLPTNTPNLTPSSTLSPLLRFIAPGTDELDSIPRLPTIYDYNSSRTPISTTDFISVQSNESYLWTFQWCALNQELLDNALHKITFQYFLNDVEIPLSYFFVYKATNEDGLVCQRWSTILTDWVPGIRLKLHVYYKISDQISDGQDTYPYQPGDYRHSLMVTVN